MGSTNTTKPDRTAYDVFVDGWMVTALAIAFCAALNLLGGT